MWVLGNYSRFIRPGAIRLTVNTFDENQKLLSEGDTDPHGLMCSAYRNTDGSLIVVVINYADAEKSMVLQSNKRKTKRWFEYRTSDEPNDNLRPVGEIEDNKCISIPKRSVVTFVMK